MYRATTPLHTFVFNVNPQTTFKSILITYAQNNEIVLEKGEEDLTVTTGTDCDGNTVYEASLRLSQEETKLFNAKSTVKVQVRALSNDDEAVASEKMTIPVYDVLNDEVLV